MYERVRVVSRSKPYVGQPMVAPSECAYNIAALLLSKHHALLCNASSCELINCFQARNHQVWGFFPFHYVEMQARISR
jgi:hypothetical protein